MKKLIVIENVGHLDPQIQHMMRTHLSNYEREIITNFELVPQKELFEKIKVSDAIAFQSTFDDRPQMKHFLRAFDKLLDVKKFDIYIVYTYESLLGFVNLDIDKEDLEILKSIVSKTNVYDVVHDTKTSYKTEQEKSKDGLFRKKPSFEAYQFMTDPVKLFWNEEYNVIWHRRRPVLKWQGDDMYADEKPVATFKFEKPKNPLIVQAVLDMTKDELKVFKNLLLEAQATHEYNKESLEHGIGFRFEEEEKAKLIAEKDEWLNLLNKML